MTAPISRVMSEAADEVLYKALCSGFPAVADQSCMARDYVASFDRLIKPANVTELVRPTRRRSRAPA